MDSKAPRPEKSTRHNMFHRRNCVTAVRIVHPRGPVNSGSRLAGNGRRFVNGVVISTASNHLLALPIAAGGCTRKNDSTT
jgi:hypothetical protein